MKGSISGKGNQAIRGFLKGRIEDSLSSMIIVIIGNSLVLKYFTK